MALVNINKGLKEEYSMNKTFSAEYDFSCVQQIACEDRFACVLTCVRVQSHASNEKACFPANKETPFLQNLLKLFSHF